MKFIATLSLLLIVTGLDASAETVQPSQQLYFNDKDGNRFNFSRACVKDMRLGRDANDRAMLEFSMTPAAECHGEMNSWVVKRLGEQVSLRFGKRVVSTSTLQSPLGANNLRIGAADRALLQKINDAYSTEPASNGASGDPSMANQED